MAMNQDDFNRDRRLEDKFDKEIKQILGANFITKDTHLDLHEGTDFLIYNIEGFRAGVRLRRNRYMEKYGNEFTVRWARPSGVDTEIHKIKKGLVDFMLYGFINEEEDKIVQYILINLSPIKNEEVKPMGIFSNDPPDSQLAAFSLKDYPKNYIIDFLI